MRRQIAVLAYCGLVLLEGYGSSAGLRRSHEVKAFWCLAGIGSVFVLFSSVGLNMLIR